MKIKSRVFIVLLAIMLAGKNGNAQNVTISPSSASICQGSGTQVTLTAVTSGSAIPVQWEWSNGVNGSDHITVSPTTTTVYTVTVTFILPSSTNTASATVTVQPQPSQATITPVGPTTICQGNSVQLNASTMDTYQWYHNGNPIPGATNQTYTATGGGNYTVLGTLGVCNIPMSDPLTVTVTPLPPANVTPAGPLSICYGSTATLTADPVPGASYQWWYSSSGSSGSWSPIVGATNQTYQAGTTGYYGIQVTVGNCTNRSFIPGLGVM